MKPVAMTSDAEAALVRAGFSRRAFLKSSGALIVGFSVAGSASRLGLAPVEAFAQAAADRRTQLDSWIAIASDGNVTAYTGKCELGQGLFTAQTQLVAEELSVPINRIRLVQCDTDMTPDQGTTSGAGSHPANFNRVGLALAAATARHTLTGLASTRMGVPVEQLTARDGAVAVTADPSRRVTYAELIGGRLFQVPLDAGAARRHPREWTVLGRPVPRVDLPDMVTARLQYVHNVRMPGMLHGRPVRPPAVSASLLSVDESSIKDLPGIVKVITRKNYVGVVAEKQWQAVQAAERLRVTWSPGSGLPNQAQYYEYMRKQPARDTIVVDSGWRRPPILSAPRTCIRFRCTGLSGVRAQWPTSRTARPPSGRRARTCTRCVAARRLCWVCHPRPCMSSSPVVPAVTGSTGLMLSRSMPR